MARVRLIIPCRPCWWWLRLAAAVVSFAFALITLGHWDATMPAGVDSSWQTILHELAERRAVSGRDCVWTYGPWGFVNQGALSGTLPTVVLAWGFLGTVMWAGLWRRSRLIARGPVGRCAWVIACVIIISLGGADLPIYAPALLIVAVHFSPVRRRRLLVGLLCVAVALCSLIKTSIGVAAIGVVGVIAIDDLRRKRLPLAMLIYLVSLVALWLGAHQPLAAVPDFVRNSWEITRGFSEAMALTALWSPQMMRAFVVSALATLTLIALQRRNITAPIALGVWLFIIFKASFVRADNHVQLAAPAALLAAMVIMRKPHRRPRLMTAIAAVAIVMGLYTSDLASRSLWDVARGGATTIASLPHRALWLAKRATGSRDWPATTHQMSDPRTPPPLHDLVQPVDIFPWGELGIHRQHIAQTPRPVLESYSAYTPRLAKLNAEFLSGPHAPPTLIWSVFPLNDVPATMEDSLCWPQVLARYQLQDARGEFLILARRAQPRRYQLVELSQQHATFDQTVEVPDHATKLIWLRIEMTPEPSRRLRALLYKPPEVRLQINEPSLGQLRFRMVPEIVQSGFLLSPLIYRLDTFRALFPGQPRDILKEHRVADISLVSALPGELTGFDPNVVFHFYELRFGN